MIEIIPDICSESGYILRISNKIKNEKSNIYLHIVSISKNLSRKELEEIFSCVDKIRDHKCKVKEMFERSRKLFGDKDLTKPITITINDEEVVEE